MSDIREVSGFGIIRHSVTGEYELFIEEFDSDPDHGQQHRFNLSREDLLELAKLCCALQPPGAL